MNLNSVVLQFYVFFFFFQAEDGIRDLTVTGVQTCALPICKTIIDATSGNTGIAYAMVGAALGFPVQLCLPDSASHERKCILSALGAELEIGRASCRERV